MIEPIELLVIGRAKLLPAGPKTVLDKDEYGRYTVERVIGYRPVPHLQVSTNGGIRTLLLDWVRIP